MFQKILLAIGDSPDSAQILDSGLTLAEKFGAEILILHVLNPLVPHGLSAFNSPLIGGVLPMTNDAAISEYTKAWQDYQTRGIDRLKTYAAEAQNRQITAEILQSYGDSGSMICDAAKTWTADAIVIGRNQKSTLSEIFLGSTSNYVLHHAACSVLVIQLPAL
jgi:nucleotide-binding universal stress UspA family protein